jgi:hypothetical protein
MKTLKRHWSLALGLGIAAGLIYGSHFFWLPADQSILHEGDPTAVRHRTIDDPKPIVVRSVLPSGKSVWKTVDLSHDGMPMRDFIDSVFRQTFENRESERSGERGNSSPNHPTPHRAGSLAHSIYEGASGLPHWVHVVARHPDGTIFYDHTWHNLRTNAGATWQEGQMAGTPGAACTYIALSNASITPNATDTTLSGEITSNGLARTLGTASYTAGATSYTVKNTFTATASQAAQATGLFTASSSGTMCFENTFTQVSLNSGDTLTVTWTISF